MPSKHFEKAFEIKRIRDEIRKSVLQLEQFCIKHSDGRGYKFSIKLSDGLEFAGYSTDHSLEAAEECGIAYNLPERWFVVKPDSMQTMYYDIDSFVDELYKLYKFNMFRVDIFERFMFENS